MGREKASGRVTDSVNTPRAIDDPLASKIDRDATPSASEFQAARIFCVLGVDPGLGGAVAFYFPAQGVVSVEDMPVVAGDVDAATLAARISQMRPDIAIVEHAASRPSQGVASVFKFGCGYGIVRGVIAASGVAMHLVSPAKWKRHFGLDADKEKSRALALRLWPARADLFGRKRDHGRAEAALIARYAAEKIVGGGQ